VDNFKTYLSGFLMIVALSYSINLHGLSHALENNHNDDSNHCELCIINHQKDQNHFILQPNFNVFDFIRFALTDENSSLFISTQILVHPTYLLGQFFNRPPPSTI